MLQIIISPARKGDTVAHGAEQIISRRYLRYMHPIILTVPACIASPVQ